MLGKTWQKLRVHLLTALVAIVLFAAWIATPNLTLAHAKLIESDPPSGAVLSEPPAKVTLLFTEDVGLDFSTARLIDGSRKEYEVGTITHDGANTATMVAPLPENLGNGSYTLIWRVVSGVDGHLTIGTVSFHVGPVDPSETQLDPSALSQFDTYTSANEAPDPIRWLARALVLAAATFLLGGSVFTLLVIEPSAAESVESGNVLWNVAGVRFAGVAAGAAVILLVGLVIDLVAQVALINDSDYFGALGRGDTMFSLLNSTRFGFAWVMKALAGALLLLLMVLVWAFNTRGGTGLWEIGIAAGSLLLLAESLSSHAAAAVNSGQLLGLPIPLISDWLHLVTVAAWIGGLAYLLAVLFPTFRKLGYAPEARRGFLSTSIPRFSRIAIASVTLLAITGTYNLIIQSADLQAILSSTYGQVLFLKIALFIALVALGAVNLRKVSPGLKLPYPKANGPRTSDSKRGPVSALWRNIRLEGALASVAIMCAGGLTLLAPPTEGSTGLSVGPTVEPEKAISSKTISTTQTIGGRYEAQFLLSRDQSGDSLSLTVLRTVAAAPPLTDVTSVLLRVTPQGLDDASTSLEGTEFDAKGSDKTSWIFGGALFPLDGQYLVNATLRRTEADDLRVAILVVVSGGTAVSMIPATALQVRLSVDPSPPVVGPSTLSIVLLDGEAQPIADASVSLAARRPASEDLPLRAEFSPVDRSAGTYDARMVFPSTGSWLLIFTVERDGLPKLKTDVSIDVGEK